jgi:glycosyltransferase involved in cell wall biosynthesis
MKVSVLILCFNEEILLKHTIEHYRKNFTNIDFTIYDNCSTDSSVSIAKDLGCKVISFDTNGSLNEYTLTSLKNNSWKKCNADWVIVIDLDEFLCVTEDDLIKEQENGTTILRVTGYNIVSDSKLEDLSDINLHIQSMAIFHRPECKNVCFRPNFIKDMRYSHGCHSCSPIGKIKFSEKTYLLKHMDILGLPYKIKKNKMRFERAKLMAQKGLATHYTNDINKIKQDYHRSVKNAMDISNLYPESFK